jgi:hypothetical protein
MNNEKEVRISLLTNEMKQLSEKFEIEVKQFKNSFTMFTKLENGVVDSVENNRNLSQGQIKQGIDESINCFAKVKNIQKQAEILIREMFSLTGNDISNPDNGYYQVKQSYEFIKRTANICRQELNVILDARDSSSAIDHKQVGIYQSDNNPGLSPLNENNYDTEHTNTVGPREMDSDDSDIAENYYSDDSDNHDSDYTDDSSDLESASKRYRLNGASENKVRDGPTYQQISDLLNKGNKNEERRDNVQLNDYNHPDTNAVLQPPVAHVNATLSISPRVSSEVKDDAIKAEEANVRPRATSHPLNMNPVNLIISLFSKSISPRAEDVTNKSLSENPTNSLANSPRKLKIVDQLKHKEPVSVAAKSSDSSSTSSAPERGAERCESSIVPKH